MAKKPRHGFRLNAKSPLAPPSLRNGRKRSPLLSEHKSTLEQLEERRLLTNNYVTGPTQTANLSNDWLANYPTETSISGTTPENNVWTYGAYDSGTNYNYSLDEYTYQETTPGNSATQAYTFTGAANPSTFDNMNMSGIDGGSFGYVGEGGFTEAYPGGYTGVGYAYGPGSGTHADHDGSSDQVIATGTAATAYSGGLVSSPVGSVVMDDWGGPSVARFTAATVGGSTVTQTVSISATFTNPLFDPNNGDADYWDWTDGQPDFGVFETNGENSSNAGSDGGTSTLLASAFNVDIASVGTVPTVGQTVTNGHGITINTPGGLVDGDAATHQNVGNDGYYGSANVGTATWSLTNVGKIYSTYDQEHDNDITDSAEDEYDMSWTYTATLTVKSGSTIDFIVNPEYNHIASSTQGDAQGMSFLSANITEGMRRRKLLPA